MKAFKFALIAGWLAATALSPAQAEVYKWVDENGGVHFGDKQPTGVRTEKLNIQVAPGKPAVTAEPTTEQAATQTATDTDDVKQKMAADHAAHQAKVQKERCDAVRKNLDLIETRPRLKVAEGDSSRYLSPEEIAARKSDFDKILRDECSDGAKPQP